jgi:hypothetical protein
VGKLDWIKKLLEIDEMQLTATCGADAALYLTYLKYCAILFGISNIILIFIQHYL